jgi:acyl dehydratase
MSSAIKYNDIEVGFELPKIIHNYQRQDLVKYAQASGDHNKIHLDEDFAKSVGLPDIIAHGMLTMGVASRVVTNWVKDLNAIKSFTVKFSAPVVVPNDGKGTDVEFSAKIEEKMSNNLVKIAVEARCNGTKVLGRSLIIAQLA